MPDAYLLQAGGGFHALARRFPGNNIIVLDSDLVDALDDRPDAINFHIGPIGRAIPDAIASEKHHLACPSLLVKQMYKSLSYGKIDTLAWRR